MPFLPPDQRLDQPIDQTTAELQPAEPEVNPRKEKIWKPFLEKVESCKKFKKKLIPVWAKNIDYRRNKPFSGASESDRIAVPLDWSMTKSKHAALMSTLPKVRVNHHPQTVQAGPWLQVFEQRLNDTLRVAGVEAAMEECLSDVINASGVAAAVCSHESITEIKDVPTVDFSLLPPDVLAQVEQTRVLPDGSPAYQQVPSVSDHRYIIQRISPADFLFPVNFTGSDFDQAAWLGRSGRVSWTQAQNLWGLKDDEKRKVVGDNRTATEKLVYDSDKLSDSTDDVVSFDEIFYKEFEFSPEAKDYSSICHLIFVNGKDEPVVDGPWTGQKPDQSPDASAPKILGSLKNPIRVLTLTYVSDDVIPPSDSDIGRAQVDEINKSRGQMVMQRERSMPFRWININRVDPSIVQGIMRGTWQSIIPVSGEGSAIIGEVARASMPNEDFTFDNIAKSDLAEAWQIGPNQQGNFASGRQSATEANVVQENYTTRIGRERAKVGKFFVSCAEVIGGLLSLFEPAASFGEGFNQGVSKTLAYSILADSTVLIDSQQRLKQLIDFMNFGAKSTYVAVEPLLREIASLTGLDPNLVVVPPTPQKPEPPRVSLRLTGSEDMMNPLALAFLINSGQAPSTEQIKQAQELQMAAQTSVPHPPGFLGTGQTPAPVPGQPPTPGAPQGQAGPLPGTPQPPVTPQPPPPPDIGAAHSGWGLTPTISKRTEDESTGGSQ